MSKRELLSERKLEGYLKLAKIVQWGRLYPVHFVKEILGIELLDYQKYVFMNSWTKPFVLWVMTRNGGKALALDTPIPTPDGFTTMGELKIGDTVLTEKGTTTKVVNTSEIFLGNKCYRVTFNDGEEIIADASHLWEVVTGRGVSRVKETKEMIQDFKRYRKDGTTAEYKYKVPKTTPIHYSEKELPIDPYVLGFWLGDGHSSCSRVSSRALQDLKLIDNKHIPDIYMFSSIEQRRELLRGLMDSDGFISKQGELEYPQHEGKLELIQQVSQLLHSLGINNKEDEQYKYIYNIEEVPSVPTKCIMVDNPTGLFLCGKNFTVTHNSTLIAPFIMAKSMLFPNHQTYILAGTGGQSQATFLKIEDIALKKISSFTGLTDVFANETVKNGNAANTTGFTHDPRSFGVELYNGSKINSLNSMPDNVRGFRSNLNFYDESGFTEEELFKASEPFLTQDSNFRLGGDTDTSLLPKQLPNQRIYASSASSTDTYFFKQYKEYSKRMMLGDPRYFVADINSDMVINATFNGKIYGTPLLSQSVVDEAMRENKEKGLREYSNIFTTEGGDQQIIKRRMIIRNSELRRPLLANDGKRKFLFAIDPARSADNSIMTIAELIDDKDVGYRLEIVNIVNFVDIKKKKKTPMKTPDQIREFKKALVDYNGLKSADYENIEQILMDDGSGGGGISAWADNLLEDWTDNTGRKHKGLIDPNHKEYEGAVGAHPNAAKKLKLIPPQKYKSALFSALQEMMSLDLISFTESYDGRGELVFTDLEGKNVGKTKVHRLTDDEIMALVNIDKAKEELVSIYEYKSGSNVRYDLAPDKKNKMHDDRAYTIAMLAWYLQELRRKDIKEKPKPKIENLFMSSGF